MAGTAILPATAGAWAVLESNGGSWQVLAVSNTEGGSGSETAGFGAYSSAPAPSSNQVYNCTDAPCQLISQSGAWGYFYNSMWVSPYNDTGASWINQNSSSLTATGPYIFFSTPASSGDSISMRNKAIAGLAFPWKVLILPSTLDLQYVGVGICFSDGAKIKTFGLIGNNGTRFLSVDNWNGVTNYSGAVKRNNANISAGPVWLQINQSSGNWIYSFSVGGQSFIQFATEAANTFLTPTTFGFFGNGTDSGVGANGFPAAMTILSANN